MSKPKFKFVFFSAKIGNKLEVRNKMRKILTLQVCRFKNEETKKHPRNVKNRDFDVFSP